MADSWEHWVEYSSARIIAAGRWRTQTVREDKGEITNFATNDYLGLSQHEQVRSAASSAIARWGTGSGSSRLVSGTLSIHQQLEEAIASWKSSEDAAVFPSGFLTNLGVMTTFGAEGVVVFSDELNHASIIDGCRLAKGEVHVYRHRDMEHLESLLKQYTHRGSRSLVVSDLVFSMDGDVAPAHELMNICERFDALLVIDEAHGLFQEVSYEIPTLRVGTLSKTLGSLGGFVAGPASYINFLRNVARSYIFTTALSPPDAAAALAAISLLRSEEGKSLLAKVRTNIDLLRAGWPSPIIPVLVGDEASALSVSRKLLERSMLVPAIRPPSVPAGTSRLRVSLSASHTVNEVLTLRSSLAELNLPL
ncbi:MAG: 8-amino-7-oxononanoate synthase [Actinobacteria bacterium]|jgi:8-amino-7-oxononanoate synthase|nr:8-amino-7-oxononanoate synthase [Actinomycetota bacterium]MCL6095988.1 8-amino-7-oxononanoate synthase [Actinomycetota bacterium]